MLGLAVSKVQEDPGGLFIFPVLEKCQEVMFILWGSDGKSAGRSMISKGTIIIHDCGQHLFTVAEDIVGTTPMKMIGDMIDPHQTYLVNTCPACGKSYNSVHLLTGNEERQC